MEGGLAWLSSELRPEFGQNAVVESVDATVFGNPNAEMLSPRESG